MPASAARTAVDARISFDEILSDDGTRLKTWTNDPDGLLIQICKKTATGTYKNWE